MPVYAACDLEMEERKFSILVLGDEQWDREVIVA